MPVVLILGNLQAHSLIFLTINMTILILCMNYESGQQILGPTKKKKNPDEVIKDLFQSAKQ